MTTKQYLMLVMCAVLMNGGAMEAAELRLTATPGVPAFSFLSWDTEGNVQTKLNTPNSCRTSCLSTSHRFRAQSTQ